ncbi:hypothetical protein [Mangrovibacterium marinum]|uniref:V/A-type H+-transporting ATPase subunit E n=1 Tax=Mangrovibacterium marinum TaxID=1639118 RepID=A0A2T5C0X7_9BACT|nr:hypothetical protein [Mangrovibacterium marinum]PTN08204.1 V/A-type H+-transporting ATPase subunit E [Mangrovibacterium marinum]
MENRLQELTEKIYREGVEKGNEEANRIIDQATDEARQLTQQAEQDARAILEKARKEASDMRRSIQAELKLSYEQAVSTLKQEIAQLISDSIVDKASQQTINDKNFFNTFLLKLAGSWSETQDLRLSIPENDEQGIEAYLAKNASEILKKGLRVEKVAGIKTGFQLGPADGSYKVSFTDTEFENFLKELLRPRVAKLLFEN